MSVRWKPSGRNVRTLLAAFLLCVVAPTAAAQTKAPDGPADWDSIKPLFPLVAQVAAGEATVSGAAAAWQYHWFKADSGVVLVPFTLKLPPDTFSSFPLGMYIRVVRHGAPAPAPGPRDALAQYPFEDAAIADRPIDGRINRSVAVEPGHYDLYVGLGERTDPSLPPPRRLVFRHELFVPDFGTGLTTSSILVVEKTEVDARNRRLTFEEQLTEPYTLWGSKLTPALEFTFRRAQHLSVMFLIYNAQPSASGKPDVEVQYAFYRREGSTEAMFTATRPELLNERTLGEAFDAAAGDLPLAGQQVPLARFPDGDYRLKVTVTDRTTGKVFSRAVMFAVAGD